VRTDQRWKEEEIKKERKKGKGKCRKRKINYLFGAIASMPLFVSLIA
jgi:hypothetical protein